jgi:selenocysteine lyase/cysteine desulfurase
VDVGALVDHAERHGARVLLDITQACGWLPVDCADIDYVVCAGYKWLLCPRGVAFMAVRPSALDALTPLAAGWYAGDDVWSSVYGSPLRLASDARRLDTSPAWFSWVGAAPTLELLASLDLERVKAHNIALADRFLRALGEPAGCSAIATVTGPDAAGKLARAGVRTSIRAGKVRASFHLYTREADVDLAIEALRSEPA